MLGVGEGWEKDVSPPTNRTGAPICTPAAQVKKVLVRDGAATQMERHSLDAEGAGPLLRCPSDKGRGVGVCRIMRRYR